VVHLLRGSLACVWIHVDEGRLPSFFTPVIFAGETQEFIVDSNPLIALEKIEKWIYSENSSLPSLSRRLW